MAKVLLGNIRFYADPASPWGGGTIGLIATATFAALTFLWLMWQMFTLATFARMESPRLAIALRQSANFIAHRTQFAVIVALVATMFAIIGIVIPVLGLWVSFSLMALLANRAIAVQPN